MTNRIIRVGMLYDFASGVAGSVLASSLTASEASRSWPSGCCTLARTPRVAQSARGLKYNTTVAAEGGCRDGRVGGCDMIVMGGSVIGADNGWQARDRTTTHYFPHGQHREWANPSHRSKAANARPHRSPLLSHHSRPSPARSLRPGRAHESAAMTLNTTSLPYTHSSVLYANTDLASLSWIEAQWAAWYIWIGNPVIATGLMSFLLHEVRLSSPPPLSRV